MSRQVLLLWQKVLQALDCCKKVVHAADARGRRKDLKVFFECIESWMAELQGLPELPEHLASSTWDILVHKMQVPLKATEDCCSLIGKVPGAGNTLIDILATFLETANDNRVLTQPGVPSELAGAIGQQLQCAGLFQHLPQQLHAVTEELRAAHPTVEVMRELQTRPDNEKGSDAKQAILTVFQHSQQAVILYNRLCALWPVSTTPYLGPVPVDDPATDEAALELVVQLVQMSSRWVDQLPAGSAEPYGMLPVMVEQACNAAVRCATRRITDEFTASGVLPPYRALLRSQTYLQAMCVATFYCAHAQLLRQQQLAALQGASSSTASSSSGKKGQQDQGKGKQKQSKRSSSSKPAASVRPDHAEGVDCWSKGCSQFQQLPTSQQQLLTALGCSGRLLLWTAHSAVENFISAPAHNVWSLVMAWELVVTQNASLSLLPHTSRTGCNIDAELQAEQLYQALPGLLLHWAAFQPAADNNAVRCCSVAGKGSRAALQGALLAQQELLWAGVTRAGAQSLAAAEVPFSFMVEYMPMLTMTLARLLLAARRSSTGAGSPEAPNLSEAINNYTAVILLLGDFLKHIRPPVTFTWRDADAVGAGETSSSNSSSGGSNGSSTEHPWQPHAAQIAAMFESYVRMPLAAESADASGQEMPFALLAMACSVGDRQHPSCLAAPAAAAGFGSAGQLQFCSLLVSLVKRSSLLGPAQQTDAEECRLGAATAAAAFAQLYAKQAGAGAGSSSSSTELAAAGAQGAAGTTGSGRATSSVSVLCLWLALFGRCCLQWAVQLQWLHKGLPGVADAARVVQTEVSPGSVMGRLGVTSTSDTFVQQRGSSLFCQLLAAVQAALQDEVISAGLTAATPVPAGALLDKVHDTAAAAALAGALGPQQRSEAMLLLAQKLQDLGVSLNTLPLSCVCNNPHCTNLAEVSELKLVKGSQHACAGCRTARYCDKECLKKHWKQHKPVCKSLAARNAGAVAAAAGTTPA